ncbi:hypothetical protein G6F32_013536 [Rhizopus arrhizus]|nr:hypothetical protein G6F32_013536 [Rhizopus arrhizus]
MRCAKGCSAVLDVNRRAPCDDVGNPCRPAPVKGPHEPASADARNRPAAARAGQLPPARRLQPAARCAVSRNRRPVRAGRAPADRAAGRRPPAGGGGAGAGQDHGDPRAGSTAGNRLRARAVHPGPAAGRPHRHRDLAPAGRPLRVRARPDLPPDPAGR